MPKMKKISHHFAEILYIFSFMLYLLGSSITLIEHGVELSLWLMVFAVVINMAATLLPWFGFTWLALDKKGWMGGFWLSTLIKIGSWGSFGYAMYYRLWRNLPPFYTLIIITTLLWAGALLLFIYSRHVWAKGKSGDKLDNAQTERINDD
jgi:hypothetical protein